MSVLPQAPVRPFSAELLNYARTRRLDAYLEPLAAAARAAFPDASEIRLVLTPDPELREASCIVYEVFIPPMDMAAWQAGCRRWGEDLYRICPAPDSVHFRLLPLPAQP